MAKLFITAYTVTDAVGASHPCTDLEGWISLFVARYCDIQVQIVTCETPAPSSTLDSSTFHLHNIHPALICHKLDRNSPDFAAVCSVELPALLDGPQVIIAGLAAVARYMLKHLCLSTTKSSQLLGFRQNCLAAPAEASVWTRFCEVDFQASVKTLLQSLMEAESPSGVLDLPADVARFEHHLRQPLRIHNVLKKWQTQNKDSKSVSPAVALQSAHADLEHCYAEGPDMTLADLLLYPGYHLLFQVLQNEGGIALEGLIPATCQWLRKLEQEPGLAEALAGVEGVGRSQRSLRTLKPPLSANLPEVAFVSLYKKDPKRYKPERRLFTKQEDIDEVLLDLKAMHLHPGEREHLDLGGDERVQRNFKLDDTILSKWQGETLEPPLDLLTLQDGIDWNALPPWVHPAGGGLPVKRLPRKLEQLQNMVQPVLQMAQSGDVIVEFCSGGGHLGIILAYHLPQCQITLIDSKEDSVMRARDRVLKLGLRNVTVIQSNLDYFKGKFDIGVALHACGVVTDLVLLACTKNLAAFVLCPCCYGNLKAGLGVVYPQSRLYKERGVNGQVFCQLAHASDQTHHAEHEKTDQGKLCMVTVDLDRALSAVELGYRVTLSKFKPATCTPKNHLIVGMPPSKILAASH